jgi:methionyl-tRNA synthetase
MNNRLRKGLDKHYTVRIKNVTLDGLVDRTFKMVQDRYQYKNDFMCDCLELGVKAYLKRELNIEKDGKSSENEFVNEIHKNNELLNEMGKYLYVQLREIYKKVCGILALSSTNEQLLVGLSEDSPRLTELVNRGVYTDAPEFIEDLMEEVASKIVEVLKK